jgi:hypothetical protein
MAEITFTGFVDEWTKDDPQHPHWGMRVSEPHRRLDGEKWITTARTRRTVKAAYEVEIDFTQFPTGSRVFVSGTEVTEVSERNGVKYENLVVKADHVEIVTNTQSTQANAANSNPLASWNAASSVAASAVDDTPF